MAIEDILDDCLKRIATGEHPTECAKHYPDYAEELTPLLEAAFMVSQAAQSIPVDSSARLRGRNRLINAQEERKSRPKWKISWIWKPVTKPFVLGFALVLITAIAAGGTTMASDSTVPGDTLYWVKTTKETIILNMSGSNVQRARAHAHLASERGEEVRKLISAGRVDEAYELTRRVSRHLGESATSIDVMVPMRQIEMPDRRRQGSRQSMLKIRSYLQQDGSNLHNQLYQLWFNASPDQKAKIYRIMKRTQLEYTLLIQALEDREPHGHIFWIVKPSDRDLY